LCTLENHKYQERQAYELTKLQATNKTFLTLLQEILGTSRNVYYDSSIRDVSTSDWGDLFSHTGISELIILGDKEDDLWT
jgi:hypothetical protein